MTTLTLNKKELEALFSALETAVDIANDTCTEDLFTDENVVSHATLVQMRNDTNSRIDKLVTLVALFERVRILNGLVVE